MRYLDEFREPQLAERLLSRIRHTATRPWTIMEVCGGQTHSLLRSGIVQRLPPVVELIHGPGCPVCVTDSALLARAVELAQQPGLTLCSFGDMLRVPGPRGRLLDARAAGADVRVVYSPLDAVRLAESQPSRSVVFLAVGFETTAPATALAVRQAAARRLSNFALLVGHVRVPPAMEAVLDADGNRVGGFLAAGHVCAVMGTAEYAEMVARRRVPIVVTGFEPVDLLAGIAALLAQLEAGRAELENAYARVVRPEGNPAARALIDEVYEPSDCDWRGLGRLSAGGLRLRARYADFDADRRFGRRPPSPPSSTEPTLCRAGEVLTGRLRPDRCPHFGTACTPETPMGAPMVSDEGACSAYWRYRRSAQPEPPR